MRTYLFTCLTLFPLISHAYLDPGTGSFILQMLVAGIFTLTFTIKVYWKKLVSFFKKTPPETEEGKQNPQDPSSNIEQPEKLKKTAGDK